ncbi:hypothetical protein J6590_053360 [Homalodisca vitripennis]|nr:hypothetical protein J6590_053360 [Homalodisca vitripennis]
MAEEHSSLHLTALPDECGQIHIRNVTYYRTFTLRSHPKLGCGCYESHSFQHFYNTFIILLSLTTHRQAAATEGTDHVTVAIPYQRR